MSDVGFRRVVRTGLAPLVDDAPDGPSWADLTASPLISDADRRVRFTPWLVGVGSAVLVSIVVGVAALLGGNNPPPPVDSTIPPSAVVAFQPPIRMVDGETWLDLTLLDGSQITLAYPRDLDITSRGVEASAVGGVGEPNRQIEVRYETPGEFITQTGEFSGPGELTHTYEGPDGGTVERWEFSDIAYLVFDFDPWTATVWDTKTYVSANAEGWAANLHGTVRPDGFLTLSADSPLSLVPSGVDPRTDGPDIRVEGSSGSLLIFINDCDRMTLLDDEAYGQDVFAFCDEPTNTLFFVSGTAEFQQRVHETLRVNPEELTTTTTAVSPTTTTTPEVQIPESGPVFGVETGVVLLLDDGLEGVIAVDFDGRRAARSLVQGQRPGDEPFSMVRVGDKLVVGWSSIYAVDIETRQGNKIGDATIFVPAADPGRVWMIDYPGGRIGSGPKTVWQVTAEGETVVDPTVLDSNLHPLVGVPGGLALQSGNGLRLWDLATNEMVSLGADGAGFAKDVDGTNLAWCSGQCDTLFLTDTSQLATIEYDAPVGTVFLDAKFSDDGRYLAAVLGNEDTYLGGSLYLLNLESGEIKTFAETGPVSHIAWAPDNDQVFATGRSYGEATTAVWRIQISTEQISTTVLPVGGGISPVVIDSTDANAYFGDSPGSAECLSALGNLVMSLEICNFDF